MTASEKQSGSSEPPARAGSPVILALLTGAQLLVVMDFTIVQVALPTIAADLGLSVSVAQWVVTAYGITLAGLLLFCGRAGDFYGHRRLFLLGLLVFSFASLSAGFAQSAEVLIASRAIQGVGAAMGSAASLSILVWVYPEGKERDRALALFGAALGSGFALGMVSSGIVTSTLGWRWVFFIAVPVGLVFTAVAAKVIPDMPRLGKKAGAKGMDLPGAITVTLGSTFFVLALALVQIAGSLTAEAAVSLILFVAFMGSFFVIEHRSKRPLLPLSFLRRRPVVVANAIAVLAISSFTGMVFELSFFLQRVLAYSPLITGLAFAPAGILFFLVSAFVSSRFVGRAGVRTTAAVGAVLMILGYLLLAQASPSSSFLLPILPATILIGAGLALEFESFSVAAFMGVQKGEEGLASGLINTSREMGIPIGTAILLTVGTLADPTTGVSRARELVGYARGFDYAFGASAVLAGLALLLALLVRTEKRSRVRLSAEGEPV